MFEYAMSYLQTKKINFISTNILKENNTYLLYKYNVISVMILKSNHL